MKGDPAEHRRFQIYEPLAQDEGPAMKRLSRGFRLRARVLADLRQLFRLHCPLEETSAFVLFYGASAKDSLPVIYGINLRMALEPNANICGNDAKPSIT